ncbi:aspartyl-tRNA synthetase [Caloramator quimbayensis]|uniref:Aspartate--tRNA ligase n=1 Tax=Caloramator quimbayensis TaxID=1147123 RepID=A0A1T4WVI6_9CLOT|nr:aspartate--tRNA ligase [Caloramator quimbayensis]SKA81363.1 aspartyl-tRNA synthetase [Caloramator quimbayensis]
MGESLNGMKRTIMCGQLRETDVDKVVTVMGWVQRRRNLGGLIFVDLRDRTGIVQVVFGEEINKEAFEKANPIRSEYVIAVSGKVVLRESPNSQLPTGQIEIKAESLRILSESETPPIYIMENLDASEAIRLKYRYLDLRRPDMQRRIMIRHKTAKVVRDFMDENGFLEIETPMLIKSTPEGARDYLVPSRNFPGKFYALPQSPQIYKQLLMISGYDRYFQIVRCFRDEDLRANRQPEFTQIDIEMSFVDIDDVIELNERLIQKIFKEIKGIDVQIPFMRMPYKEAIEKYGSDKPDLRFGMEIIDIKDVVKSSSFKVFSDVVASGGEIRGINAKGCADFGRKEIDRLTEYVKTYGAKGIAWIAIKENEIKSSFAKFMTEDELKAIIDRMDGKVGDLLLIIADKSKTAFASLGALRLELGRKLNLIGPDNNEYKFLWVTEFPLVEFDEEEGRYVAVHHPFTAPMDEDIKYLETDIGKVRAKAYDIVLNGEEIGGGSIRIHDTKLQERMFNAIGLDIEKAWAKFGYLLEAFKYGPPPHGGLAYGFDRLIMFLTETDNIKDVIAFPKNQNAADPMSNSPSEVDKKQLEELGIDIVEQK